MSFSKKYLSIAWLIFLLASELRAEDFDLAIEAITSIDPDRSSPIISGVTYLLLPLFFLAFFGAFLTEPLRGSKAQELFLPIKIRNIGAIPEKISLFSLKKYLLREGDLTLKKEEQSSKDKSNLHEIPLTSGHLRDLSTHKATIAMPLPMQRGQIIRIDLESLPGFSDLLDDKQEDFSGQKSVQDYMVTGKVKHCSPQHGDHSVFMTSITFVGLQKNSRDFLERYVNQLRSGGHLRMSKDPSGPESIVLKESSVPSLLRPYLGHENPSIRSK